MVKCFEKLRGIDAATTSLYNVLTSVPHLVMSREFVRDMLFALDQAELNRKFLNWGNIQHIFQEQHASKKRVLVVEDNDQSKAPKINHDKRSLCVNFVASELKLVDKALKFPLGTTCKAGKKACHFQHTQVKLLDKDAVLALIDACPNKSTRGRLSDLRKLVVDKMV